MLRVVAMGKNVRRFPGPWRVVTTSGGYRVDDGTGKHVASVYARDDLAMKAGFETYLTTEEARRIAKAIARLPELLAGQPKGNGE